MAKLPEDVLRLIKIYQDAQADLINLIATKEARGTTTWYQRTILKQVNEVLDNLNKKAKDWTNESIPKNYQKGIDETIANLNKMGLDVSAPESFAGLHKDAVNILASNTAQDLIDANTFVGRQIRDSVRQAGIEAVANKVATGSTVKRTKQLLTQKLIDQGLNGIKDKRGRMINLASYAETVARSTTREATNKATMNQLSENGIDLVKMSSHATTCPICAPLQGRVYSISGKDSRFPPLSRAYSGVHANIHPNCRHVLMPYVEAFNDVTKDVENSNRPFDIDERSQKQLEIYNKVQAQKRKIRDNRNQWERYKLALPDDTPKSYGAFSTMKNSNSEKWQELTKSYKELMQKYSKNDIIKEDRFKTYLKSKDIPVEKYTEYIKNLTPEEKEAIFIYTGSSYSEINRYLRKGTEVNDTLRNKTIPNLRSGLEKSNSIEDVVVWRGCYTSVLTGFEELKNIPMEEWTGAVLLDKGFMSTSIIPSAAFPGDVSLEIHVKKGHNGLAYINPLSRFQNEEEVLFKDGVKMEIISAQKVENKYVIVVEVI